MQKLPVYIVDEIGAIVAAVDVVTYPILGKHINYMYGHPIEIINSLQELTNSPDIEQRKSKFPLIALFQDMEEEMDPEAGVNNKASLHLIIAGITEPQFKAAQRYQNNFKPVLYPIYQEFIHQIANPSFKNVFVQDEELIEHTKVDRLYWGKDGLYGGAAGMLNDHVDCIEIKNLKISFYNRY